MKRDYFFNAVIRIFFVFVVPLMMLFFGARLTGFSISSNAGIAATGFLGIITLFFIILIFLTKLRPKTYKPSS